MLDKNYFVTGFVRVMGFVSSRQVLPTTAP